MSSISAGTTTTTGYVVSSDTTGALVLKTGASATTALTIGSDQSVTFVGSQTLSGGTANGVAYLNGSKVVTSGSALVFNGTNLGIGTSSPLSPLDVVVGASGARRLLFNYDDSVITIKGANATPNPEALRLVADNFRFNTGTTGSGTEKMRLDLSGNLGLGVTPSAWNTVTPVLQIQNTAFSAYLGVQALYSSNAVYTTGWKYLQTGHATYYSHNEVGGGIHAWFNAPSGTAGNAITFTQAMTLTAGGLLGVGVTSPEQRIHLPNSSGIRLGDAGATPKADINYSSAGSEFLDIKVQGTTSGYGNIRFYTGSTPDERARIDSSGNFLVGTTSGPGTPGITCNVSAAGWYAADIINTNTNTPYGLRLRLPGSGSPQYLVVGQSDTTNVFYIASNGNVQNTNNSYGAISDAKLKENIVDATPKLANLMQVKVRNYNLKGEYEQHKQLGVVAQELETIFPAMVDESPDYEEVTTTDEDGNEQTKRVLTGTTTKSVKYSVFIPMLIKAIQEQQALIESLTQRIAALEGQ